MSRIDDKFRDLKAAKKKAFIAYVMAGDPSLKVTLKTVLMLDKCGADIVELGVPFSDPLADGPVIQAAAERAIKAGVALKDVIGLVRDIRQKSEVPIVLMTYFNPVFKYGEERFMRDAARAGVDGIIVPDLPPDEAEDTIRYAKKYGVDTIFLLAPTSTQDRTDLVSKSSTGFIYYVSITGITGSKLKISKHVKDAIKGIRASSGKPVALGFGVSTPEEASAVSRFADGVIVGSAIVKRIGKKGLVKYVKSLRQAI